MVKVKRRIFELNRLKYPNFCSHDHSFSPINNPEAVLETLSVPENFGTICICLLWKLKNHGFVIFKKDKCPPETTVFYFSQYALAKKYQNTQELVIFPKLQTNLKSDKNCGHSGHCMVSLPQAYLSPFNSKIRLLTLTVNFFQTNESIMIIFSAYERKFVWLLFKTVRFEIG